MSDLAAIAPTVTAAFLGALVEVVEAFTIVLAVGVTQSWRAALTGAGLAHGRERGYRDSCNHQHVPSVDRSRAQRRRDSRRDGAPPERGESSRRDAGGTDPARDGAAKELAL